MTRLVILGAGGHGAVAAEAALSGYEWETVSFLDDRLERGTVVVGCPVVGKSSQLSEMLRDDCQFFVAIGDNQRRDDSLSSIEGNGGVLASIVHPGAMVSSSATVDAGTIICAGAVINARTRIGTGSIVNTGATVDHDCVLGEAVHISPGAHLAGCVNVGRRSWIGIGAVVRDGLSVGSDCIVGAGAAVVADIESGQTVVGVPAMRLRTS